jgi:hypothetical protein
MPPIRKLMRTLLLVLCAQLTDVTGSALADPPARVARLAYVQGTVSFAPAGEEEWVVAEMNRPMITGDRIWTDAAARTELQIGSASVRFGAYTSAAVLNLDDQIAQFEVTQGTAYVSVRRIAADEVVEIDTPNLALTIRHPGTYRVEVDANGDATAVGVRSGQADVYGEGAAYVIPSGQWYRFYATGLAQRDYAALPPPDEFDQWVSTRDRRHATAVAARYVAPDVVGYEDLDAYGTWSTAPGYGPIWYPTRVAADWSPYRDGRWYWIDPWGWTWVDAQPWGFAPSHYGRWAYVSNRWGWVPGPRTVRPVYAPALVAFVGGGNFSLSISSGPSVAIAWFPLAPGEVYRPAYRASREYFTRVNVSNTQVNTTIINNYYNSNVEDVAYRNRQAPRAVTAVPANVFVQSRPVALAAVNVAAADLSKLAASAVAPVTPSRASVLGDAPPAQHRPSAQVLRREIVAKNRPAPTPPSFAAKEQELAKQPGRPLEVNAAAGTAAAAARTEERKVKVVTAMRPPEAAPMSSDRPGTSKAVEPRWNAPLGVGFAPQQTTGQQQDQRREAKQRGQQGREAQQPGQEAERQQQDREPAQQAARRQQEQRAQQQEQQRAAQRQRHQAQQQEQQRAKQQQPEQTPQREQQRDRQQEQQRAQEGERQQQGARQLQDEQRAKQAARQQPQEQQRQERGKKDKTKNGDG